MDSEHRATSFTDVHLNNLCSTSALSGMRQDTRRLSGRLDETMNLLADPFATKTKKAGFLSPLCTVGV